jgi:hypothetical protein
MPHKNVETNYRKIKNGDLIMNNNCISKQWVGRCHMDLLIKIETGSPIEKNILYSIQELKHHIVTIIKTTM